MTMIVLRLLLRLLSLLGLKSRWHRHFSPRPPSKVFFQGGGVSLDSWTPGPKPLCHRHPTGPHPSGLLWTPWTPATREPTKSDFALGRRELAEFPVAARRRREQRLGVVVLGRAEHLLGRAVFDDAALAHHRDVVADLRGDAQVVGDEKHGEIEPDADLVEQLEHLLLHRDVE